VKYIAEVAECLECRGVQWWRPNALKSVHEVCCCRNNLILRHYCWVGEVFVLKKSCSGDASCVCSGGPKFPMFGGRGFGAVFGIGAVLVGFVMDQGFHANGDKRMPIVVMLFVDMGVHQ
jgi:hypothetical protein